MRNFSKSKLMAFRQCPKRLWLEVNRPDLCLNSAATEASFQVGHQVGDIARQIYDPKGLGALIDVKTEGFDGAYARTAALVKTSKLPIFEAGFCAGGALAFADVLLPLPADKVRQGQAAQPLAWRMVEVKSSTSVKDYHRDDVAVQAFVAQASGVPLRQVALAHIDSRWVYPGGGDYSGLLVEADLTDEAFGRTEEVKGWIKQAAQTLVSKAPPAIEIGSQCEQPFDCGFYGWCSRDVVQPTHPVHWLPRIGAKAQGITELADVPDKLLNQKQLRVKTHTLAGTVFFDAKGAAADLAAVSKPGQVAYFLDFESIQFAVPIWAGTRPYQQNCYQFSLHRVSATGKLTHQEFLDLSGADPAAGFAQALLDGCGQRGAIFVYNAAFESGRISELAGRFPALADKLLALNKRMVDLLPVARERYYHPSQQGSWSIKKVLPAVVPELSYDALDGVQDGGMAGTAFLEAIHPDTACERKAALQTQLLAYCRLDTYAMVRLWQVFAGRTDLRL